MALVTTQSATKIHQMDANFAAQTQRLALADNAYLELLPGPTIPHRHSRYITQTRATVAESATLLSAEVLQPGRKHHGEGELFEYDLYSSTRRRTGRTARRCSPRSSWPSHGDIRSAGPG